MAPPTCSPERDFGVAAICGAAVVGVCLKNDPGDPIGVALPARHPRTDYGVFTSPLPAILQKINTNPVGCIPERGSE